MDFCTRTKTASRETARWEMNKIKLKFRKTLTSQGWLKSGEYFDFEFTQEQIDNAKARTYDNPLLIYEGGSIIAVHSEKGKLRVSYFVSYYGFDEGIGEHGLEKQGDNFVKCKCGKLFMDKRRKKGIDYLNKHLEEIEKLRGEHGNK